jgi:hypothetical protein
MESSRCLTLIVQLFRNPSLKQLCGDWSMHYFVHIPFKLVGKLGCKYCVQFSFLNFFLL